ncbi:hypothetical protein [Sphingopyxis macrogoltabida]|uniref:Uncharacterized protein n=1 Tax=Sphingopyxis macrogoltabida TaxID=33050 RepID=A0A0N9UT63_SPHMC|nr:hypothetical protein [Sphingopyxis macrogoltabida]ALH83127.1 hypothetical protein AN936_23580 [Sphingopyxis macrogoltabida]
MLHGFGVYPVSLQIDIDSYEGDWRHVARFRNRSGWLAVAEAEIWTGNELCATLPMIVGCDENEDEIPAFIAANLLDCATSYPKPCYELAPPALDDLLDGQKADVRKRWLRENVASIAAIHEQADQALLEVETKVAVQTRKSDKAIARMRRQLRFLPLDDPGRALLAEAIAEEEEWQDRIIDWLGERREELRRHYDVLQHKASKGLRPRIEVDTLYLINWHHRSAPTSDVLCAWAEIVRDTREVHRRGSHPLDISDKQIKALADFAQAPGWVERKGGFIPRPATPSPMPTKPSPRRIEVDWTAMGGVPSRATDTPTNDNARDVQRRPEPLPASTPPRSASPSGAQVAKPRTRLEKTEAKRAQFQAKLEAIRAHGAGLPPRSGRFLDAQGKERRFEKYIAAFDAEIASIRARIRPEVPEPPTSATPNLRPPQTAPTPEASCEVQAERAILLERLRQLEIQGQKFRQGSPKMHRNQIARIEISRKIAALDRRLNPISPSPPTTSESRTKQDLLDEMLRSAGASANGRKPL